jgi:hypothetical protein
MHNAAAPKSGALVHAKKQKRIFKACGGLNRPMWGKTVKEDLKEEAARDRVAFSRAAHIGSNEPPPGYPSAMVASLQCPLPFHLVWLFRSYPT